MKIGDVEWIYEEKGSQGQTRGRKNYLGYDKSIRTLVRESIQNSLDAKIEESVDVKLKLICISGNEKKKLLDTLKWEYVSEHLKEVGKEESTYSRIVEFINKSKYFCIFVIEDNHCIGLRGAEFSSWENRMKNYRGFVKSENISVKENQGGGSSAGGTYGVGKFILWKYARSSLVFANSTLDNINQEWSPGVNCENPRLIGISRLPSHDFDGTADGVEGNGYFGKTTWDHNLDLSDEKKREYISDKIILNKVVTTTSTWGNEASKLSEKLGIYRNGNTFGTSIGVYGYKGDYLEFLKEVNPRVLEMHDIPALVDEVKYNWWRQIKDGDLNVSIELYDSVDKNASPLVTEKVDNQSLKKNDDMVGPLVKMYEDYKSGNYVKVNNAESGIRKDKLFVTNISTEIKTDENLTDELAEKYMLEKHDKEIVNADLLVYVPSNIDVEVSDIKEFNNNQKAEIRGKDRKKYEAGPKNFATLNCVGLVRGSGVPIIRYDGSEGRKRFGDGSDSSFFAMVLAGNSRGNTRNDRIFENFLRRCEDEGHTDWWERTQHQLDGIYDGHPASRTNLKKSIKESLEKMLISQSETSGIIRKDFAKYLKFGFKGLTKPKAKFTAIPLDSKYRNGKWQINGKVRIPDKYDDNWEVEIWPYYKSDNRNSENRINIESFHLDETENVKAEVINGLLNIKGNKECKEVQFNLDTVETSRFGGNRGRLSLRLRRSNHE